MKHTTTRISAILLALLMLLLSFAAVSCGENGNSETTTAAVDATTADPGNDDPAETEPVFADANYGGVTFLVYHRSDNAASYGGHYITAEDVSDLMSESVFKRNEAVAIKYNVKIEALQATDPYKDVGTQIDSDLCEFSAILDRRSQMASLSKKNYLYNFNDLGIDYTTPWWDANCARDYDINGKLFFMANDTSVANLAGARFFYFNKNLITKHNLENPYDLVEQNAWTLEKLMTMINAVAEDNGDGVKDGNDIYGLCMETGESNGNVMHLLVGCGVRFSEMKDGQLITEVNNQKTDDILEIIRKGIYDSPSTISYGNAEKGMETNGLGTYDFGRNLFANGHFLFIQGNMGVASQFADMTDDYGAVVNPKYNPEQESYYHKMDKYSLIWAIPNCKSTNYEMVKNVMDYWAYVSSKTVMEDYYEITIKTRRVQDPTASAMLDKVKATIVYDLSDLYGITVAAAIYSAYDSGSTLGATWRGYKSVIETNCAKLIEDIGNLS